MKKVKAKTFRPEPDGRGNQTYRIALAEADYGEEEIQAVGNALRQNSHNLAAGENVSNFEGRVARIFEKPHSVMTNSGTSALELALRCLDLPPNSEVVTPALTFATTVAAICHAGCRPIFIDSDPP